ncbi:MAG: glycosyltransferase [Flavobacteriales bacterium]|nr:glycosyltransferase [Flavobacteriales bacterium]MCX7768553.1 glycosyltransferase [Flavobacteriales bacterium]MDW8409478.1 glycosyltransferase [Flavobacteriales bacterium]
MRRGVTNERRALLCCVSHVTYDQRVLRMGLLLQKLGYHPEFYGRDAGDGFIPEPFQKNQFRLVHHFFNREVWFYAEFNIRLFFKLWWGPRYDVVVSNDLDTLPACFVVSKLRGFRLIFDSHELFSEAAELADNCLARRVWRWLEALLIPRVPLGITVSHGIAREYQHRYGKSFLVLRNVPPFIHVQNLPPPPFTFEPGYRYLILQGTGINRERGAEEAVRALHHLPERFRLILAGGGDMWHYLKNLVIEEGLHSRVRFVERLPYSELMALTTRCFAGFSLDKPTCLNYRLSLPNKIFDYIQARIPVVVSAIDEPAALVRYYQVGVVVEKVTPELVARGVLQLEILWMQRESELKERLERAASILNREKEEENIQSAINAYLQ